MQKVTKFFSHQYVKVGLRVLVLFLVVFASNYLFQLSQNDLSWDLANKFIFEWHTEKFILGSSVLFVFALFLISIAGSWWAGLLLYGVSSSVLAFANYQKMMYRMEPIYPDELKMVTELGLLKEMVGTGSFYLIVATALLAILFFIYALYRSLKLNWKWQTARGILFVTTGLLLLYISGFNNENNLLRREFNRTAKWIPYSQKMNYYNTGFMGGFLYNLKVEAMEEPAGYSEEAIKKISQQYQKMAETSNQHVLEQDNPNIVYIMSESFSDPSHLTNIEVTGDPLGPYHQVANETYSGQMLSQNYGGGTANIEFEALTGFSMEPFNAQLTTPYTMLVPKLHEIPSLVSLLKEQDYGLTAIHPYNTSMYKRKDVYQILGFEQFLDEKTMTHTEKIGNNPYISDQSAFQEVLQILEKDSTQAQFIHLVTMQTHMPYGNKYQERNYQVQAVDNQGNIENYLQDVAYTSQAFQEFLQKIDQLPERTLVVFWGDHLPSIYGDDVLKANSDVAAHQTEFLFYDNRHLLEKSQNNLISPIYFSADLFQQAGLKTTGYQQLLLDLQKVLPAFEKGFYLQGKEWQTELNLSPEAQEIYDAYCLIQYDIVSGKQYSLKTDLFKE